MAASVAFLHQVEYEAALNEFEEEAKRQFDLYHDEEGADADDVPKREIPRVQTAAVEEPKMLLRRRLVGGAGTGRPMVYNAKKSNAIANWLLAQESAASDAAGAHGQSRPRGPGRNFATARSTWWAQQGQQQQQADPQKQRIRRQSFCLVPPEVLASGAHLRRSNSITARIGLLHRIMHMHGLIDAVLPIHLPDSLLRRAWDILIMILVIWTAVTVPLSVSFGLPNTPEMDVAGYVITAMYALDLFANFRTAYHNNQGELVRDSAAIAAHYMKTWFWVDLFGTIPFDSIVLWTGALKDVETSSAELAALGFLKAPRLLRLGRLLRFLDRFKKAKIFRIVQLFLAMILISHWLACIWYMMYRFGGKSGSEDWAIEVAIFESYYDALHSLSPYRTSVPSRATDALAPPLPSTVEGASTTLSMYVVTYYYSFLLLVGDNVAAYNDFERTFCVIVLIAGTFFYSAIVGQMATLVATMNVAVNRHGQKLLMVQDALRYAGVPDKHSEKVQNYFEYLQQRSHPGSEGMQFLQELPSSLHLSLCQFLHLTSLHKVPLFQDCEQGFINALALRIRMISLSPSEVIFRVGDVGKEMYVIKKGCVAVTSPTQTIWGLLQAGEVFGEVALLSTGKRTANCTALGFVDLSVLTGPDLQVVMRDYPISAAIIYARATARAQALQSKSKMWLNISQDEDFYDCEEPDDAHNSDQPGDGGGGDSGGSGGGGGGGDGNGGGGTVDKDNSGAVAAKEGNASIVMSSSSITSGSGTSSCSSTRDRRGGSSATATANNTRVSGSSRGIYMDSIPVKAVAMAAFEGCAHGGVSVVGTNAPGSDDDGRLPCGGLSGIALCHSPSRMSAWRRGPTANGMSASLNGKALPTAWSDGLDADAGVNVGVMDVLDTGATDATAAGDGGNAGIRAPTDVSAESRTQSNQVLQAGLPPEAATTTGIGPQSPPLLPTWQPAAPLVPGSSPTLPRPARFLPRMMASLPTSSDLMASLTGKKAQSKGPRSPATIPFSSLPSASVVAAGNSPSNTNSVPSTVQQPCWTPGQSTGGGLHYACLSPVRLVPAAAAAEASGLSSGPASPLGTSLGTAAGAVSPTCADPTAVLRRKSACSDDVPQPGAGHASGDDDNGWASAAAEELSTCCGNAVEPAWLALQQPHRVGQVVSQPVSVAVAAAAAASVRSRVPSLSARPVRSSQCDFRPSQPQLQVDAVAPTSQLSPAENQHPGHAKPRRSRSVIMANSRPSSRREVKAIKPTVKTPLEPFRLHGLVSNSSLGGTVGPAATGEDDTTLDLRRPQSWVIPVHDGPAGGGGGGSDSTGVSARRRLPIVADGSAAAAVAASITGMLHNSDVESPEPCTGGTPGPVAEAVELLSPVLAGCRQPPARTSTLPLPPGAQNVASCGTGSAPPSGPTSPAVGGAQGRARRRSSFMKWLQTGPAGGGASASGSVCAAAPGEPAEGESTSPVTSTSGAIATLLQANGAAILRLTRRSSGLISQAQVPSCSGGVASSSGGAAAGAIAGAGQGQGSSLPPSRRTSRQFASTGTGAASAETVQVADEELEWISTRLSYGLQGRGQRPRRSSVCSILEEELAALGPVGGSKHGPHPLLSGIPHGQTASDRRVKRSSQVECSQAEELSWRAGSCTGANMGMSTLSGARPPSSASRPIGSAGYRRASLQIPRSATPSLPSPQSGGSAGIQAIGTDRRKSRSSWTDHKPPRTPPLPPPPPPDGVFVPRESWQRMIQALSRLNWFETALRQLMDLVTEHDETLSRLEQRAEHATALGGAGAHGAGDGILSGIMPASMLTNAAAAAAVASAAAGGGGISGSAVLASSNSQGRAISALRSATPSASVSFMGSLPPSDSPDSSSQRAAGSRFRGSVRALTASSRMRNSSPRPSGNSASGAPVAGSADSNTATPQSFSCLATYRVATAFETSDGLMATRESVNTSRYGLEEISGGGHSDSEAFTGQVLRHHAGSSPGLVPAGMQNRQSFGVALAVQSPGPKGVLKGTSSAPPPQGTAPQSFFGVQSSRRSSTELRRDGSRS